MYFSSRLVCGFLSIVMFAFVCKPAMGADVAQESLIGFSPDGRYFAFEEYGIQDGSGFPYSNLYIVDLIKDVWVADSPYSKLLKIDLAPLKAARAVTRLKAKPSLLDLDINMPGTVLYARGLGELRSPDISITVNIPNPSHPLTGEPQHTFVLSLTNEDLAGKSDCPDRPVGFRLVQNLDGFNTELHRDSNIPSSRGCVIDYRISRIIAPSIPTKANFAVALISVFRYGFEGTDRRFIAVPVPLPR